MTKRKIYFRADASATIGYGHFVRTLALADMLKNDFDCTFFTSSPSAYQIKEMGKVCNHISLNEETKFEDFINLLEGGEIVVLDNYFYTTEYQKQIKEKGCKLVCVDDMHDKHFYADIIINHGYVSPLQYDIESYTKLCIGPSYALLRQLFFSYSSETQKIKGKWIICFGGSDQNNITEMVARSLSKRDDVTSICAIVGDMYKYRSSLEKIDKINILSSLTAEEMVEQYQSSEYVVCSASSVCYEALACKCNVLAGYYVDNQKDFYHGLKNNNLIIPLENLLTTNFDICLNITSIPKSKLEMSMVKDNLIMEFKLL